MGASQDKLASGAMAMVGGSQNSENWKTVQEEIQKLSKDPSQRELYRMLQMKFKDGDSAGSASKAETSRSSADNKDNPDCIVELLKGGKRPIAGQSRSDDVNKSDNVKSGNLKKEETSQGSSKPAATSVLARDENSSSSNSRPSASMSTSQSSASPNAHQSSASPHAHQSSGSPHAHQSTGSPNTSPAAGSPARSNSKAGSPKSHQSTRASQPSSGSSSPNTSVPVTPPVMSTQTHQPSSDVNNSNIPAHSVAKDTSASSHTPSEIRAPKKKFLEGYRRRSSSFTSGDSQKSVAYTAAKEKASVATSDRSSASASTSTSSPPAAAASAAGPAAAAAERKPQGQYLNIRTCIERIMESELLRKTLQEDSMDSVTVRLQQQHQKDLIKQQQQQQLQQQQQQLQQQQHQQQHQQQQLQQQQQQQQQHLAQQHHQQQQQQHHVENKPHVVPTPRVQRREEQDEDSNMPPLLPHDIQKQIKSVYSTDIEQERNNEKAMQHQMSVAHMQAMKEMFLRADMARGPIPVSSPPTSQIPAIIQEGAVVQEGPHRPGLPPHFRPYPTRLPMGAGVEHLVTVPYPVSAATLPKFSSPKSSQPNRPDQTVSSKDVEAPVLGVIRPMVQPYRPGKVPEETGLQNYPIFPQMGVRFPGAPHLGMPMVPPGGIMAGRPPMPIPTLIQTDPRFHIPMGLNPSHVQAVGVGVQGPTTSTTPVAQVTPHGMVGVPAQQVPRHHLQMHSRASIPATHPMAPGPRVSPTPIITQPMRTATKSHHPHHHSVSPVPSKEPARDDPPYGQAARGHSRDTPQTLHKEEYPAEHLYRYSNPLAVGDSAKGRSPLPVPPADTQDEPLDLSVKKEEDEASSGATQDGAAIQHCSTHILSLQQTMQKHMDGITTQPYDTQVLVQSAMQMTPQGLPARPSSGPHPPSHASTMTSSALPSAHNLAPRSVSPRPHREMFSSSNQLPVTGEATRFDRRGSYDSNTSHSDSTGTGLDARSPSPASRASIANILGDHPPNDILFLKCSQCTSTYGSLHSFKKHFSKAHGREPTKDDVTIQSISATRSALEKENSAERQEALRSLNLLPSNKYYESQIARYKTTDFDGDGPPGEFILKSEAELLLEQKLSKSPSTPDDDELACDRSPASDEDKFEDSLKVKSEGGEQNTMKCLQCGQEFPTRDWGVFRRHVRAHENPCEGQFRCSVCRQGFREEHQWRHHMSTSHMMQSCRCRKCNIAFTHVGDLNKHLQTSHRGGQSGDVEYKCLYCVKTFLSPNDLLLHTQDHERKFEYQNRNKQGGKVVPSMARQDKAVSVPPLGLPIVRKATPDTTYSEDKRSPEAAGKDKEKTVHDPPALQITEPSGGERAETLAAANTDAELEKMNVDSKLTKFGYAQRSSSAPELQHSDTVAAVSAKGDRPGKDRELVDMYDIIHMRMRAEHDKDSCADSPKVSRTSAERKTQERAEFGHGYVQDGHPPSARPPGGAAASKYSEHPQPREGMHRLPAQVPQPHHRHTPEPRYSRSPVPAPRGLEARHGVVPGLQNSQLPLLQSVLDPNQAAGLRQYHLAEPRGAGTPPHQRHAGVEREPSPHGPPQRLAMSPHSDPDKQRHSPSQRLATGFQQQHLEKRMPSHLQQHLLGAGAPLRREVPYGSDPGNASQGMNFTNASRGLETLADAAAKSKPVQIANDGKEDSDRRAAGRDGSQPQMMSHPAAQVILTGGPTGQFGEREDLEVRSLKRTASSDSTSSQQETSKRPMFKNARTVLDEIVENALTQHQEDDPPDHVPFVQSKILQSLALDAKAIPGFGPGGASIQQRQQASRDPSIVEEAHKRDPVLKMDARPVSPKQQTVKPSTVTVDSGKDPRLMAANLVLGPPSVSRPGNVRDIIESLVTHELMSSNDFEKNNSYEEEEDSHVLSQAIRKLYGLSKSGGAQAKADQGSELRKPVVVAKITDSMATLVKVDKTEPRQKLAGSDQPKEGQKAGTKTGESEKKSPSQSHPAVIPPSSQTTSQSTAPKTSSPSLTSHTPQAPRSPGDSSVVMATSDKQTSQSQSATPTPPALQSPSKSDNTAEARPRNTNTDGAILKRTLPSELKQRDGEEEFEIKRPRST